MSPLETQIRPKLLDDFSQKVLTGGLRVVADAANPIRLNLFAAAIRELFTYTLDESAPKERVSQCSWFKQATDTKGLTRRQRAKYATQGGLSDAFIAEAGVDVEQLHNDTISAIDILSKYTHVRPGTIVTDDLVIAKFTGDALSAVLGLFVSFEKCRAEVERIVKDNIDEEATNNFVFETFDAIDQLATHHTINDAYTHDITITALTDSEVHFTATGNLSVTLQWGSNSDLRRGDGDTKRTSLPFTMTMRSPVDDVMAFIAVNHTVSTDAWFGI